MINSVTVYVSGEAITLTVGKEVTKIFTAKEDPQTIVVLMKDSIVTYTGFPFICDKAYKEKED